LSFSAASNTSWEKVGSAGAGVAFALVAVFFFVSLVFVTFTKSRVSASFT